MNGTAPGQGAVVCIPTYNEVENLSGIVAAVLDHVPGAHILICDDSSPDGTGALADRLASGDSRVHVLHRPGKLGLGKAYLAAFAWVLERDYRIIFQLDADFSHDPSYLPGFVAALASRADVVVGSRRVPGGGIENWGPVRRMVSWGGSVYARTILGVAIRDLTGGFNGYRREVLEAIDLDAVTSTGYCFQIELKVRALASGFRVVELPIVFPDRVRGKSKMDSAIVVRAAINVWRLRHLGRGGQK